LQSLTPTTPPLLAEAIAYATALDPSLPSRLRGASAAQLDELVALVGAPLPPPLRALLEWMGERDGGTDLFGGFSGRIQDLIDLYRLAADDWQEPLLPPGYVLCAVPPRDGSGDEVLVLDARAPALAPVLWMDANSTRSAPRPCAASLVQLVFRGLFLHLALSAFPHQRRKWTGRSQPGFADVTSHAQAEGFAPLWYSDGAVFCAERDGAKLAIGRGAGTRLWLSLSAATRAEADHWALDMKRRFGLDP
jgi:hypothetical protein